MIEELNRIYLVLMMHVKNFFEEEKGAVDLITVVVLIGIAVALALLFRTQIQGILDTLYASIQSKATEAAA